LASNQVEYNLLNRKVERNGVLNRCRELGVTLIAYSPLAKGMLTGKYSPEIRPPGLRRRLFHPTDLAAMQPLIGLLRELGSAHEARTPAQVALNWLLCKGVVPIPGAKNARQAADNAAALGWRLSATELVALDSQAEACATRATGRTVR
jgi:aryl-alcohol dehydrogenase-like predicted oxidoreductase